DVCFSLEEPQQFVDDAFEMQLFSGDQGEAFRQIETQLMAKDAQGAGTCAIGLLGARVQDMLKEIEVLLHRCKVQPLAGNLPRSGFEFSTRIAYFTHIP